MTDLIRYPIGISRGLLALWCTDCGDWTSPLAQPPIWTEADAAQQVTELCLANLVGIAEQHEREHHAEPSSPRFDFTTLLEPEPLAPAPHKITVQVVRVLGPNRTDDWEDEFDYDIEHTPQCDALPYGANCWIDEQHNDVGTDDWPTESGEYIATVEYVKSFNGEYTEYDSCMDFEPVPSPAPEQPK